MLTLTNVHKGFSYNKSLFRPILQGLSLTLKKGDFAVVIGNNGSGKSTLLKTITGDYTIEKGSIHLNNKDITFLPPYRRAAFLSRIAQDPHLGTIAELTVLENLTLSAMRGKPSQLGRTYPPATYFYEALATLEMGLETRLHELVATLSGGQQQALALVMATLQAQDVLLLDEHCSALDPRSARHIMQLTADLIEKKGITTLMVTHNLNDAIQYGNRLILLNQGAIAKDFSMAEKKRLTPEALLTLYTHLEMNPLQQGGA